MNILALLLTTLSLLPTPSYTQESSSSSSDDSSGSTSSFTVTAYRSDSPINNLPLTIFSGRFYLGGRTSSYCPPGVASEGECPPGNETIIVGGNGLAVSVPGGQQIYILPTGALSFTAPHSSYMPPGSSTGPFSYTPGTPYGSWNYTGSPGGPSATPGAGGGRWIVYINWKNATVPGGNVNECLGFGARAWGRNASVGAWEYI
ncbi:hypothetical protein M752DRAFT_287080 [Aspergillus phoenicis ATCC 13157]|uniref:IgE-binding protein n=1 Tax=Aspergillus phoenicis ATCC 13157 TaxID=1353007 RepID=A0A370P6A5_ASPPH|nr:hypothetical protein M752DRAFT_287080 [Aspergillus phoenicis ATCC 13157]